jgi:hypothetical protein
MGQAVGPAPGGEPPYRSAVLLVCSRRLPETVPDLSSPVTFAYFRGSASRSWADANTWISFREPPAAER